jgi:Mismatch repair ATPase (MutS family)
MSSLPANISNTKSLPPQLESNLLPLLGGQDNPRFKQYQNDTKLVDDILSKQAIALLLLQENIHSESPEDGEYEIVQGSISSHLTMDRTAMECIHLLPPRHKGITNVVVGGSPENNSIFGVLNQCKTKMGVRMLEVWLRQPCVELSTILYRQCAVKKMVEENALGRDRLRDEGLGGMRGVDLDGLCGRLGDFVSLGCSKGRGSLTGGTSKALECLYKLHMFADKQLPILMETMADLAGCEESGDSGSEHGDVQSSSMNVASRNGAIKTIYEGLGRAINELAKSVQLVEAVLDFDAAPREFLVKASFSDDLKDLRDELDAIEQEKEDIHENMNKIWEDLSGQRGQVRLEDMDSNGNSSCAWQFRIPDTNASKVLQQQLPDDVTIHRLLKNGVYFSNKELLQLGSKKHDLLMEYDKNQREVVQNAMNIAVTYIPVLERASELVAEIDVLASLAHVAAFNPHGYCRPEITDDDQDGSGIVLKEARHPCVELQDNIDFIPNDFDLIFGESSFLLVTGPNMGGKSTYIRSLAAIMVMAQIGSYVPCKSAKINIVHHLLARVGAGDLQDRGISTFMAEMLEASSILRTATKRSLIIIDELGRGTSTFDGYGLARAISEYIVQNIGCITVFATHFHELTAMEDTQKGVKNCHVTAKRSTDGSNQLSFLYEVQPGPCLESFGIQVAEMANVPKTVIQDAKRKAAEFENFDWKRRKDSSEAKFIRAFKSLPLKSFATSAEKKEAIMKLLQ